jgi:serine protease Do
MMTQRERLPFAVKFRICAPAVLAVVFLAGLAGRASADRPASQGQAADLPAVFDKFMPEGVQDLKAIQEQVKKVIEKVMPCTVGLQIGQAQGSGVIINKEGYILTAGHVSGQPGRTALIILPDGRKLKGVTLGADVGVDSGLLRITDEGADFPYVEMGNSVSLKKGQWVIAIGHPGGYQMGRAPVVRVGRILEATAKHLRTDCTLVGGDSGGPLFDMTGKVVGIHSRIGGSISFNIHVPVDSYSEAWEKLAASEVWGSPFNSLTKAGQQAYLGIRPDPDAMAFKILSVNPNSPASKAGLRPDDVIVKIDDREIQNLADYDAALKGKQPGNQVTLQVRRGTEQVTITVTLGKRPEMNQ